MINQKRMSLVDPKYVGFGIRSWAAIIDFACLMFGAVIIAIFTGRGDDLLRVSVIHVEIPLLISLLYYVGFWIWKSTSPGKMLISAEIVDAESFERPKPWQCFVRWIGYGLSWATFTLGFIWIAFDERNRGLHDYLAGTVVISTPKKNEDAKGQRNRNIRVGFLKICLTILLAFMGMVILYNLTHK